jgi:glyoxylase-like metal-dependent hydrolase (beta-lactamase superfamily II)
MSEVFHRYHVGDIEVCVVSDGYAIAPINDSTVSNASAAEVRTALAAAGLPTDLLANEFAPIILQIGSSTVLIDTGFGPDIGNEPESTRGALTRNMKANGIDPDDVDLVVVSHFHPDHVTGLVSREGPVFPNAEIAVPEPEWSFWMDDGEMSRAPQGRMTQLFANNRRVFDQVYDRVRQYRWGEEVVGGLEAVAAPGHSVGHTAFWLQSGGNRIFIQSDLTSQPALYVRNPDWYSLLDQFPDEAVRTRRRIYDMLVAEKVAVQAFHHPFPGRCYLETDGEGYKRIPLR